MGDRGGKDETTLWASRGLSALSCFPPSLVMYRVSQHEQLQHSGPVDLFTLTSEETLAAPCRQAAAAAAAS